MQFKTLIITILVGMLTFVGCGNKSNEVAPTDPQELLAYLDAKIKQNPDDAELYYQRGKVLFELSELNEAITSLKKAISLDEKEQKYYLLLADVYFRNGNTKESYANLQEALNLDPKNIDAYLKLAEISLFGRDYDRSMESIEKAISLDDHNARAFYMKGYLNLEMGDTTSAVRNLRKTIDLDNEYAQAYELLGLLFINRGDKLGLDYLTTAVNLDPNNTVALYALGLFYQENDDIEQATNFYNKVLNINSQNANALHNLGYIEMLYKENYDKAIEYFTKAIEVDSYNLEAHTNRAYAYELLGDKAKAKEGYEDALAIDQTFAPAQEGLKRISR